MKKIIFLTGTRADFGKLKSLIEVTNESSEFEVQIFATGMHLLRKYGSTVSEIEKCGYSNIYKYINQTSESSMDNVLAKTIEGLSFYCKEFTPDLIIIHGDRVEALAGAIVGSLNNILVAHIEGGEVSGTIDELIRHAVSKMSHAHFVSNEIAKNRLIQMGEEPGSIFVIGSPDIDLMHSKNLPDLMSVKNYYDIPFNNYCILLYHPVTTEIDQMEEYVEIVLQSVIDSLEDFIIIYPNNDLGSNLIINSYNSIKNQDRFRIFPSIRFEYFLTLLKHASLIIGNSSAGIREAPYYGIPSINIGTRQNNRALSKDIVNVGYSYSDILNAIHHSKTFKPAKSQMFGEGNSNKLFFQIINNDNFWKIRKQKFFKDISTN